MKTNSIPKGWQLKQGDVIKSIWIHSDTEDGTRFSLNKRTRRIFNYTKDDYTYSQEETILISDVTETFSKWCDLQESRLALLPVGVVCLWCRTSDHVVKDKDGMGYTCTLCQGFLRSN